MATKEGLYHSPAICCPTLKDVQDLAEELRLHCTAAELNAIHDQMKATTDSLTKLSQIPEPSLPVQYPRLPGYRPPADDNPYNAWYWRCDIQGATEGKLKGKTIGLKDNVAVAGVPMASGSPIIEGYTPDFDATVVTRMLNEGGRILGKASLENLCASGSSFSNYFGPVKNPYDDTRSAGGSSSGSAVLVSAGLVDMAIGADQGGSIRIPASFCGIVGLKPTYGLVPYTGTMSVQMCVDHLGPMTKTVEENALLLEVTAGYDQGRDPRQPASLSVPEYSQLVNAGISGKKIGLLKEGFDVCTERDVADLVKREVEKLKEAGAAVEEVSLPLHLLGADIWGAICIQGDYNTMVKGSGNGYFWKGFYPASMQEAVFRGFATRLYDMPFPMKTICVVAEYLNRNYQNRFYAKGQNLNMVLTAAYDKVLEQYDVLVMPTCPYKPPKLPKANAAPAELLKCALDMISNTSPFNCTGHPSLSINSGFIEGLPIGMMIVGRHFDETTVYKVARSYEKIRDQK